jgi:hypothetical protein
LVVALATVALGNLNVIAPVVSMFFLISYGLLNFATYYESRAQSPSFRPTFRWHHPWVSLAGALTCGAVMLAIDPLAGAVAGAILLGILQYVRRTVHVSRWADSGRSARLQQIRENLIGLTADVKHPRDWRPVIVAFSEDRARRIGLLRFASWIEGRSGFVSIVRVLGGEQSTPTRAHLADAETELRKDITAAKVSAFARTVYSYESRSVLPTLLGSLGMGELRANTILVNRLEGDADLIEDARRKQFGFHLRTALRLGCNLIVLDAEPQEIEALDATPLDRRRIDVWYRDDATGHLSLLLAYLTTRTPDWSDALIRLIVAREKRKTSDESVLEELQSMLAEVRIQAEAVIVDSTDAEVLIETSRDSSLVFLPFKISGSRATGPANRSLAEYGEGLAVVAFVLAAQDLDLDAEPEGGEHGEIAELMDRAADAEKAARDALSQAEKAEKEAQKALEQAHAERSDATEADVAAALSAEAREAVQRAKQARKAAESAQRRALKARAEVNELVPEQRDRADDSPQISSEP